VPAKVGIVSQKDTLPNSNYTTYTYYLDNLLQERVTKKSKGHNPAGERRRRQGQKREGLWIRPAGPDRQPDGKGRDVE